MSGGSAGGVVDRKWLYLGGTAPPTLADCESCVLLEGLKLRLLNATASGGVLFCGEFKVLNFIMWFGEELPRSKGGLDWQDWSIPTVAATLPLWLFSRTDDGCKEGAGLSDGRGIDEGVGIEGGGGGAGIEGGGGGKMEAGGGGRDIDVGGVAKEPGGKMGAGEGRDIEAGGGREG